MPLTGEQFEALTGALSAAFPTTQELDMLTQFKLGIALNRITPAAIHDFQVLSVIRWADSHGRKLQDLIAGARNQNPENPSLQKVAQDFQLDGGAGAFEALITESSQLLDTDSWRAGMLRSERAVCKVTAGDQSGTGFLIHSNLVITNYHVVHKAGVALSPIRLHFDYLALNDGTTIQDGNQYVVVNGAQWLVKSSPIAELDYALLRVAGNPANDSVAGQPGAPKRGYLTPTSHAFQMGDPLNIIQHADGKPLKFAQGGVVDPQPVPNRVAYNVTTLPGSSGAPVFTSDWRPVALHHWGKEDVQNRGVLMSAIIPEIQQFLP